MQDIEKFVNSQKTLHRSPMGAKDGVSFVSILEIML